MQLKALAGPCSGRGSDLQLLSEDPASAIVDISRFVSIKQKGPEIGVTRSEVFINVASSILITAKKIL